MWITADRQLPLLKAIWVHWKIAWLLIIAVWMLMGGHRDFLKAERNRAILNAESYSIHLECSSEQENYSSDPWHINTNCDNCNRIHRFGKLTDRKKGRYKTYV